MGVKHLALGLAVMVAAPAAITTAQAAEGNFVPLFSYRTGPYSGAGIAIFNGLGDYLTMLNERDGGIGGVPIDRRGMRDRLRHQEGRRMLQLGKVPQSSHHQPLFHGHYAAAHSQSGGRQNSGPVDGLWPFRLRRRQHFPWIFNPPATYWDGASAFVRTPRASRAAWTS